jgi:hypothetical protein
MSAAPSLLVFSSRSAFGETPPPFLSNHIPGARPILVVKLTELGVNLVEFEYIPTQGNSSMANEHARKLRDVTGLFKSEHFIFSINDTLLLLYSLLHYAH